MKALFLSFLFIFISNILVSQVTYTNYLDSTSTWHEYSAGGDGLGWQISYSTIYFDGDTLINGNYYYKQYRTVYDTSYSSISGTTTVDTFQYGPYFIREDSTLKFYQYDPISNLEYLQWDWQGFINLQVGDLFPSEACTIDTIATVSLGSQVLERYAGNINLPFPNYIIEGIGMIGPICGIGIESNYWMVCYKKQTDSLQFYNLDCNLFPVAARNSHFTVSAVSTENLTQRVFKIFPNPVENVLNVLASEKELIHQVRILDITGKVLMESEHNSLEVELNMNHLPRGMYIVHISGYFGHEYQKIMKI